VIVGLSKFLIHVNTVYSDISQRKTNPKSEITQLIGAPGLKPTAICYVST